MKLAPLLLTESHTIYLPCNSFKIYHHQLLNNICSQQSLAKVSISSSFLLQADKDQNQLNNNFKIVQLETSTSDWFPVNPVLFLPPSGHVTETDAAYLSTLFDVGGIAGGIAAGLISDTTGKSASTCAVMLVAAIPSVSRLKRL